MVDTADQTVGGTKTFSSVNCFYGIKFIFGVVAGSFTGDGSGLSSVTAGVTISNDGNNRVLTANGDTTQAGKILNSTAQNFRSLVIFLLR